MEIVFWFLGPILLSGALANFLQDKFKFTNKQRIWIASVYYLLGALPLAYLALSKKHMNGEYVSYLLVWLIYAPGGCVSLFLFLRAFWLNLKYKKRDTPVMFMHLGAFLIWIVLLFFIRE